MHVGVSKHPSTGSDNGLSPSQGQAIILTNAGLLLIRPLWKMFSEILIEIDTFSFKEMRLKMSAKCRSFRVGFKVLTVVQFCSSLSADYWVGWRKNTYITRDISN